MKRFLLGNLVRRARGELLAGRCIAGFLVVFAVLGVSSPQLRAASPEAGVDFAAHFDHHGLTFDRLSDGSSAVLVSGGPQLFDGNARYLLQANGKTVAALWFKTPGDVVVRRTADPSSPILGVVTARWEHGAISLTITPSDGPAFHTGTFGESTARFDPVALGKRATTVLDVRGLYEAELRDAQGASAGWLRVRVSSYQSATRIYDGDLPAAIDGPLAAAAVALLDADVSRVESRALDVYSGN